MGCGCGKTLTPVKFEAIQKRDYTRDKLQQFFLSNIETLQPFYESLSEEEAHAVSYLPVTRENPTDLIFTLSDWAFKSHLPETLEQLTQHICDCQLAHESFKELNLLFKLLGSDLSTTFYLLRILYYLYKEQIGEKKAGDRSLWSTEVLQNEAIHKIFRRGLQLQFELSIPRAFTEKEHLRLGCYFSVLTLFPELARAQVEDAYIATLHYCLSPNSTVQVVTAGLDFCISCIQSKRISARVLEEFPADSFTVHDEDTFDQLIEVFDSYQTMREEAWSQVFTELETHTLTVQFDAMTRYLSQPDKLEKFIGNFQRPPVVSQLFHLCTVLVQSSAKEGFEMCQRFLNRMLPLLHLAALSNETFDTCRSEINDLYQYQFSYDAVSKEYSEQYFHLLITVNDGKENSLREVLAMMLHSAMTQSSSSDLLSKCINMILHNCITQRKAYSNLMHRSITKCVNEFPLLKERVLQDAEVVLSALEARNTGQSLEVTTLEDSEEIYSFVKRLIVLVERTSCQMVPQIPPITLDVIDSYLKYGEIHFALPSKEVKESELSEMRKKFSSEVKEKCQEPLGGTEDSKVNLSLYSTPEHFHSFVCGAVLRNLTKLEEKKDASEEFKAKWNGHFQMLLQVSKSTIMAFAFDHSQDFELQIFTLNFFLNAFDKKKLFARPGEARKMLLAWEQEIIGVYLSGFNKVDGDLLSMINTVAQSICLSEAFKSLKLTPDCLSICPQKAFFADLDQNTLGLSILGGYIILSNRLGEKTDRSNCGLMITMVHELAHMGKRIQGNTTTRAHSGVRPYQDGRPGDSKNSRVRGKEGGFQLEQALFGARVLQLSSSQMKFLMRKKSWTLSLKKFRRQLRKLGVAAPESEIHYIPRTEFGLHYLDRGNACRFRGN